MDSRQRQIAHMQAMERVTETAREYADRGWAEAHAAWQVIAELRAKIMRLEALNGRNDDGSG